MPPLEENKVDIKALKRLYANSAVAKAAMDYFASRQYNSGSTKVDRLERTLAQAEYEFPRRDVIGFLRQLEGLGCGTFVIGRRGQPSRFEWGVQMISVAKASKGEEQAIKRLDPVEVPREEDEEDVPAGTLRHPYRLRPELTISLDLPSDLTMKEAARLAEFIKTLPFDSSHDA